MEKARTEPSRESASRRVRTALYVAVALAIGAILGCCVCHRKSAVVDSLPTPISDSQPKVETREVTRIMLPFYPSDVRNCSIDEFGDGERMMAEAEASLRYIVEGLAWCGAGEPGVVVDVQGFASGRPFNCGDEETSNRLNVSLAEKRRHVVIEEITKILASGDVQVREAAVQIFPAPENPRWTGDTDIERLASMRRELAFHDHIGEGTDKLPERFTRRVDLVVTKKGRCEAEADAHAR